MLRKQLTHSVCVCMCSEVIYTCLLPVLFFVFCEFFYVKCMLCSMKLSCNRLLFIYKFGIHITFLSVMFCSGKRRFNIRLWKTFTDCFNCLPIAAIIDEKIFCCHGGNFCVTVYCCMLTASVHLLTNESGVKPAAVCSILLWCMSMVIAYYCKCTYFFEAKATFLVLKDLISGLVYHWYQ